MRKIVSAVLAVAFLATSGIASAQHDDRGHGGPGGPGHGGPEGRPEYRGPDHPHGRNDHWQPPQNRYQVNVYNAPRGYQERRWDRGDRLPPAYRARGYYVDSYSRYGLYRPPSGQRWVRVDGDAVLVGITTGIVAATVAGIFYH